MRAKTDEQLIEQLDRGAPEALDELYRRYARPLHVFCATTMSARAPEDVVHDVFLWVIRASDQFASARASFRTWLFRIARNRCIDLARREATLEVGSLEEGVRMERDGRGATLRDAVAGAEAEPGAAPSLVAQAVRACLEALSNEDERQAIVLYYLGGKVYREVGAILDRSTSMAQKLVRQAREKMRRCLVHRGVEA